MLTADLHDDLSMAIGRQLTNKEWERLIAEIFGVSNTIAKSAYHEMLMVLKCKMKRGEAW